MSLRHPSSPIELNLENYANENNKTATPSEKTKINL